MAWFSLFSNLINIITNVVGYLRERAWVNLGKSEARAEQAEVNDDKRDKAAKIRERSRSRPDDELFTRPHSD